MHIIKHLPLSPPANKEPVTRLVLANPPRLPFNLNEAKPNNKPKPDEHHAAIDQPVPIACLQLMNNIKEQKEKSHQLQQKRKSPRDQ